MTQTALLRWQVCHHSLEFYLNNSNGFTDVAALCCYLLLGNIGAGAEVLKETVGSKEYKDLKANVIDTISAPVAGPMHWRVLYLICVAIAMGYFLVISHSYSS